MNSHRSGLQLHSSQDIDEPTRARISKAGAIVSADVESEGRWLVTASNDKCVRVWGLESVHERESLKVLSERYVPSSAFTRCSIMKLKEILLNISRDAPKKPTCLRLTKDGQTILVSDKFGDVHTLVQLTSSASHLVFSLTTSKDFPSPRHPNPPRCHLLNLQKSASQPARTPLSSSDTSPTSRTSSLHPTRNTSLQRTATSMYGLAGFRRLMS